VDLAERTLVYLRGKAFYLPVHESEGYTATSGPLPAFAGNFRTSCPRRWTVALKARVGLGFMRGQMQLNRSSLLLFLSPNCPRVP